MAALVYQTAWQRMLRLIFGASTSASAAVIAIFLGGLGVGGAWLGKRAERARQPLSYYGTLEAGVAICAAISPFIVQLVERAYFASGGSARLGIVSATLLRLVLAVVVMGPAVVLMGGTLPAAARSVESNDDRARGRVALLYATNTAGAVVGALLGTFLLFELLGTRLTMLFAALINLLVAMTARAIGRNADPVPVAETAATSATSADSVTPKRDPIFVYAMAGVVGFAFVGLELVWYRMLGPVLGGSSFTFGLILAVALAGIGVGSLLYTLRSHDVPVQPQLLAATLALEALCVAIPFALGDRIAMFAAYTRPMAAMGFPALVVSWTAISALVVFPTSVVAGYQFPVLIALLGQGRDRVARQLGLTYAFNTLGSIVGALLVGLVIIPRLGALTSWRWVVIGLAVLAVVALGFALHRQRPRPIVSATLAAGCALSSVLCLGAEGPTAAWRHAPIGAGRATISGLDRNGLKAWQVARAETLLWERDGVESSVAIDTADGLSFIVNGKSDGSVVDDRGTQGGFGLLLSLLHPNPRAAFIVGLGTGMTAGFMAAVPGMQRVDVAELEPAILQLAKDAAAVNADVPKRSNLHVYVEDGREFLLTSKDKYDLIASEPSNPYRAGIASLFTQEFYEAAATRLNPGGLFGQWVQGYEIDIQTLRSVMRTLRQVFSHVELWHTQTDDLMLIASKGPRTYDADRIRRRMAGTPFSDAMPRLWLVEDVEGAFAHFLGDTKLVQALSEANDPPINTDDNAVLEYAFARSVGIAASSLSAPLLQLSVARNTDRLPYSGNLDWNRLLELRTRAWLINPSPPPIGLSVSPEVAERQRALQHGCEGRFKSALDAWRKQPNQTPRDTVEEFVVGAGLAHEKDPQALELAQRLEAKHFPAEAGLIRARYHQSREERELAVAAAIRALGALRGEGTPLCATAGNLLELLPQLAGNDANFGRRFLDELLRGPFAAYVRESHRQIVIDSLAFRPENAAYCLRAMNGRLTRPPWREAFLAGRYECLRKINHPYAPQATRELEEFLAQTVGRLAAGL
jgi:spermidine synthase